MILTCNESRRKSQILWMNERPFWFTAGKCFLETEKIPIEGRIPSVADLLTNKLLKSVDKVYWITGWRNGWINNWLKVKCKQLSLNKVKDASLSKNGTKHCSWLKTINFDQVDDVLLEKGCWTFSLTVFYTFVVHFVIVKHSTGKPPAAQYCYKHDLNSVFF